jgi:predicted transcriptional regulator
MTLASFMDEIVWAKRYTTYPVVDDGRAVGLLPFQCVAQVPRAEWDDRLVRECMLELGKVPVLGEDEQLVDAVARLTEDGVRRGLVLDGDRLVGLLSVTDVARALEVGGPLRRRRTAA